MDSEPVSGTQETAASSHPATESRVTSPVGQRPHLPHQGGFQNSEVKRHHKEHGGRKHELNVVGGFPGMGSVTPLLSSVREGRAKDAMLIVPM